jgi:Bacterial PH domain
VPHPPGPPRQPKYRFWPERAAGPVDDAYHQIRWVRPYRPGPVRVGLCLLLLFALLYATMVSLLAVYGSASLAELAVRTLLAAATCLAVLTVAVRAYLSGVWVTDDGVRVLRPLSTHVWTWAQVADVRSVPGPTRLAGTPVRVLGHRLVLVLADGTDVQTPLTDRSPDFLGRVEAYDMAASAVEGWLEIARRRDRPRGR